MLFRIINTNEDSANYLVCKYPILTEYGYVIVDDDLWGKVGYININSLIELIEFCKKLDREIIITNYGDALTIEIYDYWRE